MIAPKEITVTIDGRKCKGTLGQTILQIAQAGGIAIPTLCHLKHLSPWGGCRMCIVEIGGSPKAVPSCTTPATDGSTVTTDNPRLQHLRRLTLELLFSERNHVCPICPMNKGDCDLQQQAYKFGIDAIRYPYLYPQLPVDVSGKYFGLDHNRCILCTRCVRTCDEIEGVHTLDIGQRGVKNQVVVDLNTSFGASTTCTQCGACVAACPTGALFDKQAAFHGPLSRCQAIHTTCTECSMGCGLIVYTKENRIIDVMGDPDSPVNHGHLCVRGRYETWAESRPRILHPMIRRDGQLVPASWQDALTVIQNAVQNLTKADTGLIVTPRLTRQATDALMDWQSSVGRIGMYVSKNEAALCAEPDFPKNSLEKIADADAIIVLGTTPSHTHGVLAARIRTAVRKNGAKLIILQSHKSDLDTYADIVAHVVSLERTFWTRIRTMLQSVKRPVLVYGAEAMTAIGVTVLDRLIKVFDTNESGQSPALIGVANAINVATLAQAGLPPVDNFADWLATPRLKFLHIAASDDADGGDSLLQHHGVTESLQALSCLVVQASYSSRLTDLATVVLPTTIWCEKHGTITNFEGRELPVRPSLPVRGEARADKTILEMILA